MKNTSKICSRYYEIKRADGAFSLGYTYESEEECLKAINESYKKALANGYDNSSYSWDIFCVEVERIYEGDKKLRLLKEITQKFVVANAEYNSYEGGWVISTADGEVY